MADTTQQALQQAREALKYVKSYLSHRDDWEGTEPLIGDIDNHLAALSLPVEAASEGVKWPTVKAVLLNECNHAGSNNMRLEPRFGQAEGPIAVPEAYILAVIERFDGIAGDAAPQEQPQKDQVHLASSANAMVRNSEAERSAFEAWVVDIYGEHPRRSGDSYLGETIADHWMAWQARAALAGGASQSVREQAVAWRVASSFFQHYGSIPESLQSEAVPLYASPLPAVQTVPDGYTLIGKDALQVLFNALERDAKAGRAVRGEMVAAARQSVELGQQRLDLAALHQAHQKGGA